MHIVLDANIYAADYRMSGVSFRTLFEYMRRTESQLVLPRLVREEVVLDYGRRLKAEAKIFAEVWNKYRHLDLGHDRGVFQKPNIKHAMIDLRRKLMKPADGVAPLYVAETKGVSADDVFMRGARRIRPANQQGEELRDVILWLWALAYSNGLGTPLAFISNDTGFWDKGSIHPEIEKDIRANQQMSIYRSIDDFAKQHAPPPSAATEEWVRKHFKIQSVEGQLIDRAASELRLSGLVRDLTLEHHEFMEGNVYDVARQTQFAELRFKLFFKFSYSQQRQSTLPTSGFGGLSLLSNPFQFGSAYLANANHILGARDLQPDDTGFLGGPAGEAGLTTRELHCEALARIAVRIKGGEPSETSIDRFELDRLKVQLEAYRRELKAE